jgi:hypothetical protein
VTGERSRTPHSIEFLASETGSSSREVVVYRTGGHRIIAACLLAGPWSPSVRLGDDAHVAESWMVLPARGRVMLMTPEEFLVYPLPEGTRFRAFAVDAGMTRRIVRARCRHQQIINSDRAPTRAVYVGAHVTTYCDHRALTTTASPVPAVERRGTSVVLATFRTSSRSVSHALR